MGKKRALEHKINNLLGMFPAVAIIGPRQCGKSTLVKQLLPNWKYFDLENPDDYRLITENPTLFFELNDTKIIIDEAQQYPELFKVLRGVIDKDRNELGRFVLTGSSSPEIVKGLTESLAGRIATTELFPFKFSEFYDQSLPSFYRNLFQFQKAKDFQTIESNLSTKEVLDFWFQGGFPGPSIKSKESPDFMRHWKANYINDYIKRDIRGLFPRLNIHSFQRFVQALAHFSGHQVNKSSIARSLEVSVSTVSEYLSIIHQTFIWRNLEVYEKNRLKKIQKAPKGFFRDAGILHYLMKINSLDDLLLNPIAGYSFESFVVEEIIRGIDCLMETQVDYSYYRTVDKAEVDLIIDSPHGVIPIEVKLASKINKRSLRGLENFISDMQCKFGVVIYTGDRIIQLTEKIILIPVRYI